MRRFLLLSLLMAFSVLVFAQTRTVTGNVVDETSGAVPFASITEKGTTHGASADANGAFTIDVKTGAVLVISATGFQSTEVRVTGPTVLVTLLKGEGELIEEVVVTALGQKQNKNKVATSSATFNSESITKVAPVSLLDGLQGKIAVADISTVGGQPGASSKVVLRGYGVIGGGNNQPLYVIDGVPLNNSRLGSGTDFDFGNGMNDLNPNDIESITVLKGTAASSLYGSLARNGAIMITTKRGNSGKLKVDFNSSVNITQVDKLPVPQTIFGQGWGGLFWSPENGSWGPRYDGKERLWGSVVDNSQLIKPFSFIPNNVRNFYDNGVELNNSISLSGGNETNKFYFSYGNINSDGIVPTNIDYLNRHNFALRTNSKFNKFSIGSSFNFISRFQKSSTTASQNGIGSSLFEDVLQIPNDVPITDFYDYKNKFFNVDNYFTPYAENPYYMLFENGGKQNSERFFGNLDMSYSFTNWLTAQLRIGGDWTNARTFIWYAKNKPSPGSWNDGGNTEGSVRAPDVGSVTEIADYSNILNGDFLLKATKRFSDLFSLDFTVGTNYYQSSGKSVGASVEDLKILGFYNLSNSSNKPTAFDALSRRRSVGVYSQAILGLKDFFYLTLNARNDWSSTLPTNNNSFFYPGASASWIVSKMLDMTATPISLLKLRAGYGKTGADPAPYQIYSTLAPGSVGLGFGNINFPYNGVSAFEVSNIIGNPILAPIITKEFEAGTEIRFFKNRLGLDATYYDKKTEGQIFNVPISPSTGYTSLVSNIGLVTNKGIELTLDGSPVATDNFNWNVIYTFARNRSNVDYLSGELDKVTINSAYDAEFNVRPGYPVGIFEAPIPKTTSDGRIIVNPGTGYPIQADTKGIYGTSQRDFSMGLSNTWTYKNISFGVSFDFRKGGIFYSGTADLYQFTGNSWVTTYNERRPFIIPNSVNEVTDADGNVTGYVENTKIVDNAHEDGYYYHTTNPAMSYYNRIIDASFLKMRDLTLSYRLPKFVANKIRSNNLSITLFARNILVWTPSSNVYIDPEASNYGNDLTSQFGEFRTGPTLKSFGVALKALF